MSRHGWAKHFIHELEHNPRVQFKFHLIAVVFWMFNAVAGTVIMILLPHVWIAIGVFYVFLLSIYANADTDYDAMSASIAAMHGEELLDIQNKKSDAPAPPRTNTPD